MSRALDDPQRIVDALWVTGWIHNPRLDDTATPFYEESIALATAVDYAWGAVHAHAWFGMYKVAMGDYEGAKPVLIKGIEWANRLGGDASLIGRCQGNLGQAEMLQGHLAQAHVHLDQSLVLQQRAGNQNGVAEALWLQGRLAVRAQDFARAGKCFKESLALYRAYPMSVWVTRGLAYLMIAHLASGREPIATRLAGALAARDGGVMRVHSDLGSLAAIAEYDAAVASIREQATDGSVNAAWNNAAHLEDDAVISFALDEGPPTANR